MSKRPTGSYQRVNPRGEQRCSLRGFFLFARAVGLVISGFPTRLRDRADTFQGRAAYPGGVETRSRPSPASGARPHAVADARERPWHQQSHQELLTTLDTSAERGLSTAAAHQRLAKHGANVLPEARGRGWPRIMLAQLTDIMVLGVCVGAASLVFVAVEIEKGFLRARSG